jgi:hypothetical protein
MLPALAAGGLSEVAAVPGVLSGLLQTGDPLARVSRPPAGARPVPVTVAVNSPPTVVDLGPVFAAMSGIRQGGGLKLWVMGNTNAGLVQTDLSKAALTLTFTPGRWGTATITVGATDADGVSVQQTILVTVDPLGALGLVGATPTHAAPLRPGTSP